MKTTIKLLLLILLSIPITGFGKCFVTISPCVGSFPFAPTAPNAKVFSTGYPIMPYTGVLIPPSCGTLVDTIYTNTFTGCGMCTLTSGSASLTTGYTPPAGQCIYDAFLVENCLPNGPCLLDTVIVTFTTICLEIEEDTYLAPVDSTVMLAPNPVSNDRFFGIPQLDPCDLTVIEPVANGTLMMMGPSCDLVYTPNLGFSGVDTFIYEICSGGTCNSGVVSIYVTNAIPTISEWGLILTGLMLLLFGSKKIMELTALG